MMVESDLLSFFPLPGPAGVCPLSPPPFTIARLDWFSLRPPSSDTLRCCDFPVHSLIFLKVFFRVLFYPISFSSVLLNFSPLLSGSARFPLDSHQCDRLQPAWLKPRPLLFMDRGLSARCQDLLALPLLPPPAFSTAEIAERACAQPFFLLLDILFFLTLNGCSIRSPPTFCPGPF